MSQLTHPEHGRRLRLRPQPDGVFYYAMEYLDGGIDLEKLVDDARHAARRARAPDPDADLRRARRSARPRLIHRDIKPANIILCERGAHARRREGRRLRPRQGAHAQSTGQSTQVILGTPAYIAPEAITDPTLDRPGRRSLRARLRRLLPAHRPAGVRRQDRRRSLHPARDEDAGAASQIGVATCRVSSRRSSCSASRSSRASGPRARSGSRRSRCARIGPFDDWDERARDAWWHEFAADRREHDRSTPTASPSTVDRREVGIERVAASRAR